MHIKGLQPSATLMLQTIASMPVDERARLPVRELARKTGLHRCTVQRNLKRLKAVGYLRFDPVCGRGVLYSIELDRRVYGLLAHGYDESIP